MSAPSQPSTCLADRLHSVQVGTRQELEISRHVFRGKAAYVVMDPVTFKAHHLSAEDYQVFVALDGQRPLRQVFESLVECGNVPANREDDFYRFVVNLNQLGLLNLPLSDGKTLYARFEKKQSAQRRSRITGILFLRVPLFQPDAFLTKTLRYAEIFFSRRAFLIWLAASAICIFVLVRQWHEFSNPLGTMLALQNLPILWSLLVGLKVIHEFGHAYACKHFGGKVPEMGAYFILFTPCAYVDASAAWGFSNRAHRIVVSLAGMYFESIIAMLAVAVWSFTGPSALHSAAHYTILLSTAVTIGFNINPLMKYDGYYILTDLANVPNLRQLASTQLNVHLKRLFLGIATPPVSLSVAGQIGLTLFGIASGIYKTLVLLGISAMVAFKIPAGGLALALGYLLSTFWKMGSKLVRYVAWSPEVTPVRYRAIGVTSAALLFMVACLSLVPAPGSVQTVGIVGRRDDRAVRATASGFLEAASVQVGDHVDQGVVFGALENVELQSAVRKKGAEVDQLRVQLHHAASGNRWSAAGVKRALERAEQEHRQLANQLDGLKIRAPIQGNVTRADGLDDLGRFVRDGEPLAEVSSGPWVLKSIASEQAVSSGLPEVGDRVEIRLTGHGSRVFRGTVMNLARSGTRIIDDASLTHLGGGSIAVSADTMEAEEPFFRIEISIDDANPEIIRHGMTALATFPGRRATLGRHFYRRTLQFLNHLRAAG